MLRLRAIRPDDFMVFGDGQLIGGIRLAHERPPAVWLWNVTPAIPSAPFGEATTLEVAKQRFSAEWEAFKAKCGPEKLAKAFAEMNWADRPDRYRW
jgi:hypothetical protein